MKTTNRIILCLCLIILLIVGCAGNAFKKAQQSDTREAYKLFLDKYPDTDYSNKARERIRQIDFEQAKRDNTKATAEVKNDNKQTSLEKIALNSNNKKERILAIEKLSNQETLYIIAVNDKDKQIRLAAVNNIKDLNFLRKIILEIHYEDIQIAAIGMCQDQETFLYKAYGRYSPSQKLAIERLINQEELANIALDDFSEFPSQITAIKQIADQKLLLKIASTHSDFLVRLFTITKLQSKSDLYHIFTNDDNKYVRLTSLALLNKIKSYNIPVNQYTKLDLQMGNSILKVLPLIDSVPLEHSKRIILKILDSLRLIITPDIVLVYGEIVSIKGTWEKSGERSYSKGNRYAYLSAETVTIEIKYQKIESPFFVKWKAKFPHTAYPTYYTGQHMFIEADIDEYEIVKQLFVRLPQSVITKYALEGNDWKIRELAILSLKDTVLLSKIANEDDNSYISRTATERLKQIQE